jgi:uncharacterized protein YcbK (DUF882 family)
MFGRRAFLTASLGAASLATKAGLAANFSGENTQYSPPTWLPRDRRIVIANVNTREAAVLQHSIGGNLVPEEIARGSWLLRDHREQQAVPIDSRLFDILYTTLAVFKSSSPIFVTSGYRTPSTNSALSERFPGVASNSFHMYGKAIDFWIPGIDTFDIFRFLSAWGVGGVGYYPLTAGRQISWVHVDTGSHRWWVGESAYSGRRTRQDLGRPQIPSAPG